MRHYLLIILIFLSLSNTFAKKKLENGLNSISENQAKAIVNFLASNALEGRAAGTHSGLITSEFIASYLVSLGIEPLSESYFQPFQAYNQDSQKKSRYSVDPDSINKYKQDPHRVLNMRNVLGIIPGVNTNDYIIVGAHFDHLGIDTNLVNDKIYNGADDNASGVSAVMQIAHAFVNSGIKPQRNIVFAFWDGEELGLLGSKYFTNNCEFINQIKGYLNFDMIGRNSDESNPMQVTYFYDKQHPAFGEWLKNDIKQYNLKLRPDYHPSDVYSLGGSDNSSFGKHKIPIIWYHTGGHPDYHKPSDEASRINWTKLVEITRASFLNVWNLANEEGF